MRCRPFAQRFAARADSFQTGSAETIVYCASSAVAHARGLQRLMVEGGRIVHTQFLTAGLADELHLVVASFFVGDSRARRFVSDALFPWNPGRRAALSEVCQIGDVVLLRYALSGRFDIDLAWDA